MDATWIKKMEQKCGSSRHGLPTRFMSATLSLFGVHEDDLPMSPDLEPTEDIVPEQIPSILDQRACIVYSTAPDVEPRVVSTRDLESDTQAQQEYRIHLRLDMTNGCGGKIWPAAEVLGAYIASMPSRYAPHATDLALAQHPWRGKTVVELGSGTGLIGFLVAKIGVGCKTWITDQVPMLPLMEENVTLNPDMVDACHVAELNWGETLPESVPSKPDVILLADCVYREEAFQPLVDTLCMLSTPSTEILFCYHKRRRADKRFFQLLKHQFTYENVNDDDERRRRAYQTSGTFLMRFTKRA